MASCALNSQAFAQSAVEARATSVRGRASISGNGRNSVVLLQGTVLGPGDVVDTGADGRIVIDLSDGSQVVVFPNSRLVFGDYRNASSLRELLQIVVGRIRVKINHFQGKPNPYRIKSPTASIAVRGTKFEVAVKSRGETRVTVTEGAVEVSSLRDPSHPLLAEPKRGVMVRPDSTVDFFISETLSPGGGEPSDKANAAKGRTDDEDIASRSAGNIYEQAIGNVFGGGRRPQASRFVAFPDAYLDSVDNPAYAAGFTNAEGRLYFLPSFGLSNTIGDRARDRLGLSDPRSLDYALIPEATVFVPVRKLRSVFGVKIARLNTSVRSLTVQEDASLSSTLFPDDTTGLSVRNGSAAGRVTDSSLFFARRFGARDQTSIGFSIEHFSLRGSLDETATQRDITNFSITESRSSRSEANRTRLTFGFVNDFGRVKLGGFFRRSFNHGGSFDNFHTINDAPVQNDFLRASSNSSEVGFKARWSLSRRIYIGMEGGWLVAHRFEDIHRSVIVDSSENTTTRRTTVGVGLGLILSPRTILSFDVAGGLIRSAGDRTENATSKLLESKLGHTDYLSFHVALQKDLWSKLFASTSLMSIGKLRTNDLRLYPDRLGRILDRAGVFAPSGRSSDLFANFYSNYGLGWRFKPNFMFEYIFSTDYGETASRQSLLLRYNFDIRRR